MALFRQSFAAVVAFALPPRCPGCGVIVDADRRFCAQCWQAMDFLTGPGCVTCGAPLAGPPGGQCAPCMAEPPVHDGVRAAVAYGPIARALVLKLKYGRKPGQAALIAEHLARRITLGEAALLVPVPLHRWRLWGRGFNQAALIAQRIAAVTGLPVAPDLLRRVKRTPPLRGLGRAARARAVQGAFRAVPDARRRIGGRAVYLVDDVYTSGATANACAAALKRAGAARVTVLCWARVVRDEGD
ncbi:ComF family protein [Sphingomonas flavalba]|uniref:ComF family protein n=1 Tax=Sphingomonas flavalba TaxID=2559804 RepID=UPI00109DF8B3|nr:ComF family protein [Sphingomonas flavalba]